MAVAAAPPSISDPSWDETIVPALRQRLEKESRVLSKRLSAHSIPSGDEAGSPRVALATRHGYGGRSQTELSAVARSVSPNQKPSSIPRPSLQEVPRIQEPKKAAAGAQPVRKRTRTQSSPYLSEFTTPPPAPPPTTDLPLMPPPNGIPTPASSRAGSPFNASPARPSRIPTAARQRSGSNSSHGHSSSGHGGTMKLNGLNGVRSKESSERAPPSPENSLDLFPVVESQVTPQPRKEDPQIRDEKPPFDNLTAVPGARTSVESIERPFEHWYRGDTSRNGGVGELRVVGRKEMLEIANFGHQRPISGSLSRRKRAGSVEGRRESWLLDDKAAAAVSRVMDETPLTDLDDGTDFDASSAGHQPAIVARNSLQSKSKAATSNLRAPKPVPVPVSVSTPIKVSKSAPPNPSSTSKVSQQKRGRVKPPPQKKANTAPPAQSEPSTPQNTLAANEDTIPWTQPAPRVGNWDEIVLPVVSKRMGIEGYGIKSEGGVIPIANGQPSKQASRDSMKYPPAPGTFGYDSSKRRDLQDQTYVTEFGIPIQPPEAVIEESPMPTPTPSPRRPIRRLPSEREDRSPSPAPFSSYPPTHQIEPLPSSPAGKVRRRKGDHVPAITVSPPSPINGRVEKPVIEDGESAGCCKCVIM